MNCPECGKPAIPEGEFAEMEGVEPGLRMWFCLDCLLMKRPFSKPPVWLKASKDAIAVMLDEASLERFHRYYTDRWTWDTGDEESREWMDVLSKEIELRKNATNQQAIDRLTTSKIDFGQKHFRIYIDGEWK